jgi:hypothetical protein
VELESELIFPTFFCEGIPKESENKDDDNSITDTITPLAPSNTGNEIAIVVDESGTVTANLELSEEFRLLLLFKEDCNDIKATVTFTVSVTIDADEVVILSLLKDDEGSKLRNIHKTDSAAKDC